MGDFLGIDRVGKFMKERGRLIVKLILLELRLIGKKE